MVSVTGLPFGSSQLMGSGGDENSATVLAAHKEKPFGQMMHMIWTNPSHRLGETVPSNRLQTADLRQLCSQWRRGSRPKTSVLCLTTSTITGTRSGIVVIGSSLEGQYHPQTPQRISHFHNLVRGFKGHRRELRSARSRMAAKAGKAGRIRRVKILVFEANFKLGFPSHLLHRRGPEDPS